MVMLRENYSSIHLFKNEATYYQGAEKHKQLHYLYTCLNMELIHHSLECFI